MAFTRLRAMVCSSDDDLIVLRNSFHQRDLIEDVVPWLMEFLKAEASLLYRFDEQGNPESLGGTLEPAVVDYTQGHIDRDPIHRWMASLGPQNFIIDDEPWFHKKKFRNQPAFSDFYLKNQAEHVMGIWPDGRSYGEPGMVGLMLGRSARRGDFDDSTRRAILSVFSELRRVFVRVERSHELLGVAEALGTVIDHSKLAVIILGADGRELHRSAEAARLFPESLPEGLRLKLSAGLRAAQIPDRIKLSEKPRRIDAELSYLKENNSIVLILKHTLVGMNITPAERRVLNGLSTGASNAEIAKLLFVSTETVRSHIKSILRKLQARSRTEAALIAQRHGLLP